MGLTLGRCKGDSLFIDWDIEITVSDIDVMSDGRLRVRLAIKCPDDVAVTRGELLWAVHERAQRIRDAGRVPTKEDLAHG